MKDLIEREKAIKEIEKLAKKHFDYPVIMRNVKNVIEQLPSAELEIVKCKDCKWKQGSECVRFAEVRPLPDDFCSRAERRTDGSD